MNSEEESARLALADRIRACAKLAGGGNELARRSGVARSSLENYMTGIREPKVSSLGKIALAANVNAHWLVTGQGPTQLTDASGAGGLAADDELVGAALISAPELLALVTDAIQRTYKDAGASLSALDLGRLSAEKYNEIIQEIPEPEGWPVAVKMMAVQLRKDIASTAANPGARKREAS